MKKATVLLSSIILLGVMAGCGKSEQAVKDSKNSTHISETSQVSQSSDDSQKEAQLSDIISVDEAVKLYQETYPNTDITDLTLELSFGKYYYHIDGIDDNDEYELTINADTKELSDEKKEKLDNDEKNGIKREEEKLDLDKVISIEKASDIAVKEVGFGEATEWSLDRELKTTYWDVTVKEGRVKEAEVKIDAQSGDVLSVEKD